MLKVIIPLLLIALNTQAETLSLVCTRENEKGTSLVSLELLSKMIDGELKVDGVTFKKTDVIFKEITNENIHWLKSEEEITFKKQNEGEKLFAYFKGEHNEMPLVLLASFDNTDEGLRLTTAVFDLSSPTMKILLGGFALECE